MPESLLTILKFCFLAVLYLFFLRVLRAVWAELRSPHADVEPVAAAATPTVAAAAAPGAAAPVAASAGAGAGFAAAAPRPSRAEAPRRRPHLQVVDPPEARGQVYEIHDELTLGRGDGCSVHLDDTFVSQRHARVFRHDDRYFVEDLGSTNGTFLNRSKVSSPAVLHRGDRLQVGRTVMELDR